MTDVDGISAEVALDSAPVCARCQAGKGCGAGAITTAGTNRLVRVKVPAGTSLKTGDSVQLTLAGTSVAAVALTVYGLPLGGALLGGILGYVSSSGDMAAAILAGVGLLLGAWGARQRLNRQCPGQADGSFLRIHGRVT